MLTFLDGAQPANLGALGVRGVTVFDLSFFDIYVCWNLYFYDLIVWVCILWVTLCVCRSGLGGAGSRGGRDRFAGMGMGQTILGCGYVGVRAGC